MKALQILLVEDDPLISMLLAERLVDLGHGVCAVEGTRAGAMKAAIRWRPDLLIVDAQLGDGNGVSAVDQILQNGFVPHLFMSGNIRKVLARRPSAVWIEKPFCESELVQAIQRALVAADSS
jgi:CheY-like chemotaxis protein